MLSWLISWGFVMAIITVVEMNIKHVCLSCRTTIYLFMFSLSCRTTIYHYEMWMPSVVVRWRQLAREILLSCLSNKCHTFHDDVMMWNASALLALCEGNPPVTGGFPSQRASNAGFDVFFVVSRKQLLTNSRIASNMRSLTAHSTSL